MYRARSRRVHSILWNPRFEGNTFCEQSEKDTLIEQSHTALFSLNQRRLQSYVNIDRIGEGSYVGGGSFRTDDDLFFGLHLKLG